MAEEVDKSNWLLKWAQVQTLWLKIKTLTSGVEDRLNALISGVNTSLSGLTSALETETTRAQKAEKDNKDAIKTEETARISGDNTLKGLIDAHQSSSETHFEQVNQAIKDSLDQAKEYANSVATGAMHWMGTCSKADLEEKKADAKNGDFWSITDEDYKEYAFDGNDWFCVGADVDFSEINSKISDNAANIATEKQRAENAEAGLSARVTTNEGDISNLKTSVASKAENNGVVHLNGNEVIGGYKEFSNEVTVRESVSIRNKENHILITSDNSNQKKLWLMSMIEADKWNTRFGIELDAVNSVYGLLSASDSGVERVAEISNSSKLDRSIANNSIIIPTGGAVYSYLNDSSNNFVHKSGDETIDGIKKFTGDIHVTNPKAIIRGYNVGKIDGRMILAVTEYEGNGQASVILESRKDNPRIRLTTGTIELEVKPSSTNASEIKSGSNVLMTGGAIKAWSDENLYTKTDIDGKLNGTADDIKTGKTDKLPTCSAVKTWAASSDSGLVHTSGDENVGGYKVISRGIGIGSIASIIPNGDIMQIVRKVGDDSISMNFLAYKLANNTFTYGIDFIQSINGGTDYFAQINSKSNNYLEYKNGAKILTTAHGVVAYCYNNYYSRTTIDGMFSNINDKLNYITDEMIDGLN